MTISIKLNETLFDPGGLFYGIPKNRAVLAIGVGRNDIFAGKINTGTAASLSYRGGQTNFQIDTRGTELTDNMFEYIMQNETYVVTFGAHILDMLERELISVFQDGVLLADGSVPAGITAVKTFTA